MEKKKINTPLIVTSIVVVAVIAIIAVLIVKMNNSANQPEEPESTSGTVEQTIESIETTILETIEEISTEIETSTNKVVTTKISDPDPTKVAEKTEPATEDMKQVQEEVTVPELKEEEMKTGKGSVATATSANNLPKDMSFSGLYKSGYDVIGLKQYIYNDDMSANCSQRKLGYNSFYDSGAKLIDFTIDTVKLKFNYDGKTYRIQLWKGQYISGEIGTVGGEFGIYTHEGENSVADHFQCAQAGDELYMELTILWDEYDDGVYRAQLTRNYALHWWETGYVDGQLKNKRDSNSLRLLSRVTFKDEEQAQAFEAALLNKGFTKVGTFNPTVPDTFKRYEKDVILVWQSVR